MPWSSPDSEEVYSRCMIKVENVYCKSHEYCHFKYSDPASQKLAD